jgi:hypothetical protein
MAKKKKKTDKEKLHKITMGAVRNQQKEQGALDGRFREKKVPSKKSYKRKKKHKKGEDE